MTSIELSSEQKERATRYRCFDCGNNAPVYMAHDHVWKTAWPDELEYRKQFRVELSLDPTAERNSKGRPVFALLLCFSCLERRLGRPLTIEDFRQNKRDGTEPLPANAEVFFGYQLGLKTAANSRDKKDEGG